MKDYTSTEPVFSEIISVVEEDDLVNTENNNAAAIQLLQNILVLAATKVNKEEGKSLVSNTERNEWNAMYRQATGYTDQKIADLIGGAPSTLDTLEEIAAAMADNADVVEALNIAIGSKANQSEMESLLGTKLEKTGDSKDNTVTFTSSDTLTPSGWTDVAVLKSGETHKSFVQKVATMIKNVRYLWKLIGSTDISEIGDGTVTGALNSLNTGTENSLEGKYVLSRKGNTVIISLNEECTLSKGWNFLCNVPYSPIGGFAYGVFHVDKTTETGILYINGDNKLNAEIPLIEGYPKVVGIRGQIVYVTDSTF